MMYIRDASPLLKQIWVVSSILLFNVGCGMMNAQTTLELVSIQADSPMKADPETWIGSKEPLIIILGLLSSALLMDCFGRRTAFIVATFASIISCCTIYFATDAATITIGRMFRNFAVSGVFLGAMVIGEYTSPIYRGVFLTLASTSLELGRTIAYFIGNYEIVAIFALVLSVLSYNVVCTWDESPYFLASRYQYDDWEKSFIWLRGTGFNERQELAKLIQKGKETESKIRKKTLLEVLKKVATMKLLKPIVLILFASILLETSGKTIFNTYGTQIIGEIFGKYLKFYTSVIYLIATSSMIFSSILVKVLKRRTLLFYTGLASVILCSVISLTMFLISNTIVSFTTLVPLALLLFLMFTNLSCSTMFLTWCGELFPLEHKSVGLIISGVIFNINNYLCYKLTPYLINGLKLYGLFGFLTVLLTLTLFTLYFIAPETYNKTLLQIECYFENGDFEEDDAQIRDKEDVFFVLTGKSMSPAGQTFL